MGDPEEKATVVYEIFGQVVGILVDEFRFNKENVSGKRSDGTGIYVPHSSVHMITGAPTPDRRRLAEMVRERGKRVRIVFRNGVVEENVRIVPGSSVDEKYVMVWRENNISHIPWERISEVRVMEEEE